jgi:hypothetical protein
MISPIEPDFGECHEFLERVGHARRDRNRRADHTAACSTSPLRGRKLNPNRANREVAESRLPTPVWLPKGPARAVAPAQPFFLSRTLGLKLPSAGSGGREKIFGAGSPS